jgi:hypothetical protein
VKVRAGAAAGVADQPDYLTDMDSSIVSDLNLA